MGPLNGLNAYERQNLRDRRAESGRSRPRSEMSPTVTKWCRPPQPGESAAPTNAVGSLSHPVAGSDFVPADCRWLPDGGSAPALAALSGRERPQSAAAPSPTSAPAAAAPASSNASPTASAIAPLTSACALPCSYARLQRARRPNRYNNQASPPCRTKLDTFTPSGVHQAGLERRTPA